MSTLGPCRCGHPGAGCTCYDERLAEVVRQPDEAAGEPLDGPGRHTETPEAAAEAPGGAEGEARDRALLARHFRVLASAVNVEDWPAYLREVAAGHEAGTSWYQPVQAAPEEPEPPVKTWRPHWLPEEVWMGVIVGQWPLATFPNQEAAERWAANAAWLAERQAHEQRRIWRLDIPVDTQTFRVEKIPASTVLVEVEW